jgi:rRNA-processing protein FCF1
MPTRLCVPEADAVPDALTGPGPFVGEACRAIACPALALCAWRTPHLEWRVVRAATQRYPPDRPCPMLGDGRRMRAVVALGQPLAPSAPEALGLDPDAPWARPTQAAPRPRAKVRPAKAARTPDLFLVDAMVFIGAQNGAEVPLRILEQAGGRYALATTPDVLAELRTARARARADGAEVIDAAGVDLGAFEDVWYAYEKRPSEADLSLLRAALKDARVRGIVTSDSDLTETAAGAVLTHLAGRRIRVVRPGEFVGEYG